MDEDDESVMPSNPVKIFPRRHELATGTGIDNSPPEGPQNVSDVEPSTTIFPPCEFRVRALLCHLSSHKDGVMHV